MKHSRLVFTLIGLGILVCLAVLFWIKGESGGLQVGIWALWFASFNTLIGVYTVTRHLSDKVIAKHYEPNLDTRLAIPQDVQAPGPVTGGPPTGP